MIIFPLQIWFFILQVSLPLGKRKNKIRFYTHFIRNLNAAEHRMTLWVLSTKFHVKGDKVGWAITDILLLTIVRLQLGTHLHSKGAVVIIETPAHLAPDLNLKTIQNLS